MSACVLLQLEHRGAYVKRAEVDGAFDLYRNTARIVGQVKSASLFLEEHAVGLVVDDGVEHQALRGRLAGHRAFLALQHVHDYWIAIAAEVIRKRLRLAHAERLCAREVEKRQVIDRPRWRSPLARVALPQIP